MARAVHLLSAKFSSLLVSSVLFYSVLFSGTLTLGSELWAKFCSVLSCPVLFAPPGPELSAKFCAMYCFALSLFCVGLTSVLLWSHPRPRVASAGELVHQLPRSVQQNRRRRVDVQHLVNLMPIFVCVVGKKNGN